MTQPDESTLRAWTGLIRAQHAVLSAVEADLKAAGFPPLAWYDVLLELRRAEPDGLRPYELQQRMLLAQYNLSRLADRLHHAGNLEKRPCPDDGRGHVLRITRRGRGLLKRMWPVYGDAVARHVGDKLKDTEAGRLAALLAKLNQ